MMEAQRIAKKAGKIRFLGVSTHGGQKELLPWVAEQKHFDVVLTTYNFTMDQAVMDAAIDSIAKVGIGVVAMKVMAGGQKPLGITPSTDQTKDILRREGASLAALKWSLRNPQMQHHHPEHGRQRPARGQHPGDGRSLVAVR